jgi:hypothetical protein
MKDSVKKKERFTVKFYIEIFLTLKLLLPQATRMCKYTRAEIKEMDLDKLGELFVM